MMNPNNHQPEEEEKPPVETEGVPGLGDAIDYSSYELLRGLVGRIVHDFNNYLAAIGGNIEMALREMDEESNAAKMLSFAQQAAQKAGNLASQLSNLSENGLPVVRGESFGDFVRDSVCFVLTGSKIACECDFPDDLNEVRLDEREIGRIIQEAVINASRDMSNGGVLAVRGSNEAPSEEGAEATRVKLEFGYRPSKEEGDVEAPAGTVKGSTVRFLRWETVRNIVEENGGTFDLSEEPGNWTHLAIHLPAVPRPRPPAPIEGVAPTTLEGRRVLLLEDETLVLGLTQSMLEELGCSVLISRDGSQAVETYREARSQSRPVDIAILDLTIPGGMGGEEAAAKILDEDPGAKLVVSSGFVNERTLARYEELGFKGVLRKPFRLAELEELLRKVLR
jgi:CheY-like chemotaxis protein